MKNNPGRAERRRIAKRNRDVVGKRRAKLYEYIGSHRFLKKYKEM